MHVKMVPIVEVCAVLVSCHAVQRLPFHASSDNPQKRAAAPSPEQLAALRDAKTASFLVEEFRKDDELDSNWHYTVRTYLRGLLDHAKIKLVDSGGDVTFTVRSSVKTASATYVPRWSVIGTILFQGKLNPPTSIRLGAGPNPIVAALGNSDLVPDFLDILITARGPFRSNKANALGR